MLELSLNCMWTSMKKCDKLKLSRYFRVLDFFKKKPLKVSTKNVYLDNHLRHVFLSRYISEGKDPTQHNGYYQTFKYEEKNS